MPYISLLTCDQITFFVITMVITIKHFLFNFKVQTNPSNPPKVALDLKNIDCINVSPHGVIGNFIPGAICDISGLTLVHIYSQLKPENELRHFVNTHL